MFSSENSSDSWIWIIIVFALLFGWGNGGFGGGNSTMMGLATQADMQRGFDNQNIMGRFDTIGQNITNSAYENAQLINGLNQNISNGFAGVNTNINNLSHQLSDCCCALKTQMLQDKYDQAQNQLNLAEIASSNAVQTQNILASLGKWYANPPINPYYVYNGTTIS